MRQALAFGVVVAGFGADHGTRGLGLAGLLGSLGGQSRRSDAGKRDKRSKGKGVSLHAFSIPRCRHRRYTPVAHRPVSRREEFDRALHPMPKSVQPTRFKACALWIADFPDLLLSTSNCGSSFEALAV